jgi:hypothetical protein
MCITYLDYPKVPEELLKELPALLSTEDEFPKFTGVENYAAMQCYQITGPLLEWIKNHIPIKFSSVAHINHISDTIVIHRDYQVERYKVNYIFDAGGPAVQTRFYDDDKNLIDQHVVPEGQWHTFDSMIYHNVTGIIPGSNRIAITLSTDINPCF